MAATSQIKSFTSIQRNVNDEARREEYKLNAAVQNVITHSGGPKGAEAAAVREVVKELRAAGHTVKEVDHAEAENLYTIVCEYEEVPVEEKIQARDIHKDEVVQIPQIVYEKKVIEKLVDRMVDVKVQVNEEEIHEIPVDKVLQQHVETVVQVPKTVVIDKQVDIPVIEQLEREIIIPKLNKITTDIITEVPIQPVELNQQVIINRTIKKVKPIIDEQIIIIEREKQVDVPLIETIEEVVDVYVPVPVEVPVIEKIRREEQVLIPKMVDVPVNKFVEVPVTTTVTAYVDVPQVEIQERIVDVPIADETISGRVTHKEAILPDVLHRVEDTERFVEVVIGSDSVPVPVPRQLKPNIQVVAEVDVIWGPDLPAILKEEKVVEVVEGARVIKEKQLPYRVVDEKHVQYRQ